MNAWAIVTGIVTTALAVWYVVAPLLEDRADERPSEQVPDLQARYREALRAILDLEADYETGKLERSDYEAAVRELKLKAARMLRKMEDGGEG